MRLLCRQAASTCFTRHFSPTQFLPRRIPLSPNNISPSFLLPSIQSFSNICQINSNTCLVVNLNLRNAPVPRKQDPIISEISDLAIHTPLRDGYRQALGRLMELRCSLRSAEKKNITIGVHACVVMRYN